MDKIYGLLLKQLLDQPFPYQEILKRQLDAAKYDTIIYDDTVRIVFYPDDRTDCLPENLDIVPLRWQLFPSGGCMGCELFVVNGYVDYLQIVDYAGSGFIWDELNQCIPKTDIDYDQSSLYRYLSGEVQLQKIQQAVDRIDIALADDVVACFRGCIIHRLDIGKLPSSKKLQIELQRNGGGLYSADGSIEIEFNLAFLRYNMRLS